jgi:hypothetical protein
MRVVLRCGLLAAALGCSQGGSPAVQPEPQSCPAERVVAVFNDWNRPVDIYGREAGSAYDTVLGVVQPGTKVEITLQAATRSVYALPSGPGKPSTVPPDMKQLVRFRYFCR